MVIVWVQIEDHILLCADMVGNVCDLFKMVVVEYFGQLYAVKVVNFLPLDGELVRELGWRGCAWSDFRRRVVVV